MDNNNSVLTTEPPYPSSFSLPKDPLIVITPSKSWVAIDFRDLWLYRELLYLLTWREIGARYKQTVMGTAWVIMQPLMTMVIYSIFLGKIARIPSNGIPYPLFVYSGLLPWSFFSGAIVASSYSIISNSNLITKVYFPRMIIPTATIAARAADFAVSFLILIGMMFYYHLAVTWNIIMLPALFVLIVLLSLGVGMWMAALNVRYRDLGFAIPSLIQVWMFASPVVYPLSLVPERWQKLYTLNPMVGLIGAYRSALFGLPLGKGALAYSVVFTLCVLVSSLYAFKRIEKSFADLV